MNVRFAIALMIVAVLTGCLGQSGPAGAPGGGSSGGILNPGSINPGGMNPGGSIADPLAAPGGGGGGANIGGGAGAMQDEGSAPEDASASPPVRPPSNDVPEPLLCVRRVNCPQDRQRDLDGEDNGQGEEGDGESSDDGRGSLAEALEEEMEEREESREEFQRELGERVRESGLLERQQPAEPEEPPVLPLMNADAGQLPDSMNQLGQAELPQNAAFPYPNAVQQPAAPASQGVAAPAQRIIEPASPLPYRKLPKNINSFQLTPSGT